MPAGAFGEPCRRLSPCSCLRKALPNALRKPWASAALSASRAFGASGALGASGASGPRGLRGLRRLKGFGGLRGRRGLGGHRGLRERQGAQEPRGSHEPQGPQAPQGPWGPRGGRRLWTDAADFALAEAHERPVRTMTPCVAGCSCLPQVFSNVAACSGFSNAAACQRSVPAEGPPLEQLLAEAF